MVYIHGGGFQMDCAQKYHYKHLARLYCKQDVLVVTIEYRLGYLGYLCLDNKNCKGNFGLWDQVFALRFVHDNIRLFGGDSEQVTVFGQSAGGVSTALLAISPVSRGFPFL
jgi:carboxylesterase type B